MIRINTHPLKLLAALALFTGAPLMAQQADGPQANAPASAQPPAPKTPAPKPAESSERIAIPSGTRIAVVLENGISTRSAKAGDSLYFRTSFPITQNNHVVIPVGSYLQGQLLESKRPGRIKGHGEFRMKLTTLIFPNGYTVDLNAEPRSADSGGKETTDSEGKVSGPGKGSEAGKIAQTTAETAGVGAGIGAATGTLKGVGIGAGLGAAAGLAAMLLTRGPDAELPRGSTLDVVLEHELALEGTQIQFTNVGQAVSPTAPPPRQD